MDSLILEKVEAFFTQYKCQIYKKGEILIRADDNPPGIFFLKNGYVKQYIISKKGDELVVNIFKPSAFFPMSWAINDTQNAYFYEAMTNLELFRASKKDAIKFVKNNPDVLFDLLSRVYYGTEDMLTRITYLMSGNAYNRLIIELLINSKRFGKRSDNSDYIFVDISEKDLANQAGMSRETVSRELKILKEKRLTTYEKGQFIILDLKKLEGELL